jgi:hypothetical protein
LWFAELSGVTGLEVGGEDDNGGKLASEEVLSHVGEWNSLSEM